MQGPQWVGEGGGIRSPPSPPEHLNDRNAAQPCCTENPALLSRLATPWATGTLQFHKWTGAEPSPLHHPDSHPWAAYLLHRVSSSRDSYRAMLSAKQCKDLGLPGAMAAQPLASDAESCPKSPMGGRVGNANPSMQ